MTTDLDLLTRAEQALVRADHVPELNEIIDMAEAARVLAQRAHLGQIAENRAALIKLRAQRKAGEILAQMRIDGERSSGAGARESQGATLAELGVTKQQSSRWQQLAEYYTDDELQLLGAKATDESESLSYKDLIRKIRARNSPAPTEPPAARPAAPPTPGVTTLIEDIARSIFHLDPDSTRVELAGLPDADRAIAVRLLVDAERTLHDLVSDFDRRRIDIWDELSEGVDNQRAIALRAELDAIFVEEHGIKTGDVVDHDGSRHTIVRDEHSAAPDELEVHAAPAPDLGDAHASDPASTDSSAIFLAEGAAASNLADKVLCAFPGCVLDDEHDGDHDCPAHRVPLSTYEKAPRDLSNAEAWARQQIQTALTERPDDPEVHRIQQELYAGVDENRAREILEQLTTILQLDDYVAPTTTPTERQCRDLIAQLPADHQRVSEIQQMLYHGVNPGTAAEIRRELKDLKRQLVTTT